MSNAADTLAKYKASHTRLLEINRKQKTEINKQNITIETQETAIELLNAEIQNLKTELKQVKRKPTVKRAPAKKKIVKKPAASANDS